MTTYLPYLPVILALLCALLNLVRRQWIANMIFLALQYLAVFIILLGVRNPGAAVIKLLVGWMVTLVIYISLLNTGKLEKKTWMSRPTAGEVFRFFAGLLVIALTASLGEGLRAEIFPATSRAIFLTSASLMLIALLQLGMKEEVLYTIIGLMTFMSGFELLYASLELSALLEAFFVAVNLGLALIGAYFIVNAQEGAS
ncbi:MAG: hypothetical protein ACOYKD_01155 [Anaerolineaceae bacterium]|jgi:hypothetical protein